MLREYFWLLVPVSSAALVPYMMALVTILVFLFNTPPSWCIADGLIAGAVMWVLSLVLFRSYATAAKAIPSSFAELRTRLSALKAQDRYLTDPSGPEDETSLAAARNAVRAQCDRLEQLLNTPTVPALDWVLATGYLDAWECLHRAEEALIEVQDRDDVIDGAITDALRLDGSNIDHVKELSSLLQDAVADIEPSATRFFDQLTTPVKRSPPAAVATMSAKRDARAVLRVVRRAINEYVDQRYASFITARNRLACLLGLVGMTGWVLLAIEIILQPDDRGHRKVAAAAVYFLFGALVGLLSRLYAGAQKQAEPEVLDYGLSEMRLLVAFAVSGMAAVAGVILAAVGSVLTLGTATQLPSLSDILNLQTQRTPVWLIWAAIFGLAPTILFTKLQQQADKYASDVARSEAGHSDRRTA